MKLNKTIKLLSAGFMAVSVFCIASRIHANTVGEKAESVQAHGPEDQSSDEAAQNLAPHHPIVIYASDPDRTDSEPEPTIQLIGACQTNAILDFDANGDYVNTITVITHNGCTPIAYGDYQWQGLCMLGWSTNGCSGVSGAGVTVTVTPESSGGYPGARTVGTIEVIGTCGKASANLVLPAFCTNCSFQFYTSGCCQVGVCTSCNGYNNPN